MKTTVKTLMSLVVAIGMIFTIFSCQKDDTSNISTTTSTDNSIAESSFNDLFKVVEEAEQSNSEKTEKSGFAPGWTFGDCATVTIDPFGPVFPKTITIDFGDTNCVGTNGTERRGKIIATISGRLWEEGSMKTITTEDYYINDAKVEGTKTITNEGRNDEDFIYFSIVVENGKVTTAEGLLIEWYSSRERAWIEGEETNLLSHGMAGVLDDVFLVTGNGGGVNRNGLSYTMLITKALRIKRDCRWITEGTAEITPAEEETRILDYGDGECDNIATVTVGDEVREITLHGRRKF